MIKIIKDGTNNLALTLNERSTIYKTGGTPYWLFQFTNSQTLTNKLFNPVYISATTRYNLLSITEDPTDNLTGGTVNLKPGYYSYKIYEQPSQYNLQISATTSLVEYGKVLVMLPNANIVMYTGNSNENIIYYK